jgi:hypothetical protein
MVSNHELSPALSVLSYALDTTLSYTPSSLTNQHLCNTTNSTSEKVLNGAVAAFSFNLFYCVGHFFFLNRQLSEAKEQQK